MARAPSAADRGEPFKDALLAQIKGGKPVFYNMVVAQAQTIEVAGDRVTFTFSPNQRALRDTFEQNRAWLESIAQQVAGRRIAASCVLAPAPPAARRPKSADTEVRRQEVGASRAGARRRRRADDARGLSRGNPRRRGNVNIQQMMKQAQQMQERLQQQMAELRVEGNAGGGMVTVIVNGAKQVQSLKIDPEVVLKEDVEMLQDLIVAAINDAHRKADEEMSQKMGGMLPPGMKLPGM